MFLVRLLLPGDHAGVREPVPPSWRPPLCPLAAIILRSIVLGLLSATFLLSFNTALQFRQLRRLCFDGLSQNAILFLQRRHLLRNVTGSSSCS